MAKFYGQIGYIKTEETAPGVYEEKVFEKNYTGDILKNTKKWQPSENLNESITINNIFSILADSFAYENYHAIRYIKWMGASWKVTSVEFLRPRLILTIGGIHNG